jgi:hypothetical protein
MLVFSNDKAAQDAVILVAVEALRHATQSKRGTFILLDVIRAVFPDASDNDRDLFSSVLKDLDVIRHSAYTGAFEIIPGFSLDRLAAILRYM